MIVVSRALALTLTTSRDANKPIIGYRNFASSVVAESALESYPASNLLNPATDPTQRWRSDSSDDQTLEFAVDELSAVDYIGIARHNFGSGQIVVSVEIPDTENEGETIEIVPEFMPGDDAPILIRFPETYSGVFILRLQPQGDTKPWAAVVYVGKLLALERGFYVGHTPLPYARSVEVANGRTQRGDFLGQIVTSASLSTPINVQNLTPTFYRSEIEPFIAAVRSKAGVAPFFFAWRPQKYPNEIGYAWLTDDPKPSNQRANGMMQVSINLEGLV